MIYPNHFGDNVVGATKHVGNHLGSISHGTEIGVTRIAGFTGEVVVAMRLVVVVVFIVVVVVLDLLHVFLQLPVVNEGVFPFWN